MSLEENDLISNADDLLDKMKLFSESGSEPHYSQHIIIPMEHIDINKADNQRISVASCSGFLHNVKKSDFFTH